MNSTTSSYRLNYAWRLTATGLAFLLFGLGGLVLGLSNILLALFSRSSSIEYRAQKLRGYINQLFRLFVKFLTASGILNYEIQNPAGLDDASLVIANHPTLLDVVFLVSFIPNAVCVVKDSLFHHPCIGFVIRNAGYISNKDPQKSIDESVKAIEDGAVVVIFPEGTRTTPGQNSKLHRGAAYVSLQANVALSPIHISCVPSSLTKAEKWYEIPDRKMQFVFTVEDRITQHLNKDLNSRTSASRQVTKQISQVLFTKERHAASR